MFWDNMKAVLFQGWWWKDRAEAVETSTWLTIGVVIMLVVVVSIGSGFFYRR